MRATLKQCSRCRSTKSDRNDAARIARIMQTGWFKEVRVKNLDSHAVKALLASRALLVKIKRDLENQVRGLLKNLGLVIGPAKFNVFAVRAEGLIENRPELVAAVRPLLEARKAIEQQVEDIDRKVHKLARRDVQVRRFMTCLVSARSPHSASRRRSMIRRASSDREVLWGLYRVDDPTSCLRGDRLVRPNLEVR